MEMFIFANSLYDSSGFARTISKNLYDKDQVHPGAVALLYILSFSSAFPALYHSHSRILGSFNAVFYVLFDGITLFWMATDLAWTSKQTICYEYI